MGKNILMIMDPLESIKAYKDTSVALMQEAQARGWTVFTAQIQDIYFYEGDVYASVNQLELSNNPKNWYRVIKSSLNIKLSALDLIWIRKDPPFDTQYSNATLILDLIKSNKTLIINDPKALRDANEKLFALQFYEYSPTTIVSSNNQVILKFLNKYHKIVLKPLDSMGGNGIISITKDAPTVTDDINNMTYNQTRMILAQVFLPNVMKGDKRVLMINGEVFPFALNRIPKDNDFRANLAVGGKGVGVKLSSKELDICSKISPILKKMNLFFVGLDIIDENLTEINVTSPTGVREIESAFNVNICSHIFNILEQKLSTNSKG